jgi:hypothetical protein
MLATEYLKLTRLNQLTTKSLRFLPILESFTDIDRKILTSVEDLKEKGIVTARLIPAMLEELVKFRYLTKDKNGNYYNNYHYSTNKNEKKYSYINLYEFMEDERFTGLYKRDLSFFYYISTRQLPGNFHTIAAELLYKNEINRNEIKFEQFQDFKDMAEHISNIVAKGFLEIKIGTRFYSNPTGENQEAVAKKIEKALYTYCSKDSNKKSRIRNKRDRHLLKIRVTESLLKNGKKTVYDTRSTLKDLQMVALKYGHDLEDYVMDDLKPIHILKDQLFKQFGNIGIDLYREGIEKYFEDQAHSFGKHIENGQFSNIIKKIYVMPKIVARLNNFLTEMQQENTYSVSKEMMDKSENYIEYLTSEAYLDDMVLFDHEINNDRIKRHLRQNTKWFNFFTRVDNIYLMENKLGNSDEDVIELAKKGLLTNKSRQEEDIRNRQIAKEKALKEEKPKTVPFYNWLDQ